jgi:hypothetical protein
MIGNIPPIMLANSAGGTNPPDLSKAINSGLSGPRRLAVHTPSGAKSAGEKLGRKSHKTTISEKETIRLRKYFIMKKHIQKILKNLQIFF